MGLALPDDLALALDADDAEALDELIRERRPEVVIALRELATTHDDVDPVHRQRALYALGRLGDPSVVDDVVAVLPELDEPGRIAAIETLGRLPSDASAAAVRDYAGDPSPNVRKFVIQALGRLADPASTNTLRAMAQEDPVDWLRARAAKVVPQRSGETS